MHFIKIHEPHHERAKRLKVDCNAHHLTFGGRCLNCGYTPVDYKPTPSFPAIDRYWET